MNDAQPLKSASHNVQLMHGDTFKQGDYSTAGGDGGCRVGEVRASTTSPMPNHKGFNYQRSIYSLLFLSEFSES